MIVFCKHCKERLEKEESAEFTVKWGRFIPSNHYFCPNCQYEFRGMGKHGSHIINEPIKELKELSF